MANRNTSPSSTVSVHSNITVHTEKHPDFRASSSASPPTSTPPTSLGDDTSVMSELPPKIEQVVEQQQDEVHIPPPSKIASVITQSTESAPSTPNNNNSGRGRPTRSSRSSVVTYNVQILAGTAIHTPTKYLETHHGNVLHGPIDAVVKANPSPSPKKRRTPGSRRNSTDTNDPAEQQLAAETAQAAQRRSSRATDLRREALRNLSGAGELVANAITGGKQLVQKTLKRSASDSRLRSSTQTAPPASAKRPRTARDAEPNDVSNKNGGSGDAEKEVVKPKSKQWLSQGLFVGQTRGFDARLSGSQNRARLKSRKPKENNTLPLPMFTAGDSLDSNPKISYRDFKLPFDVYNPLLRKVKVDGWTKISKNRFIGEASALWKREKQDSSQCYCEVEDGCGEACHNRIMAYECDASNCRLTEDQCTNRPFADLKKRSKSNGYDYGVEVMQTEDKGYGVRAMRSFNPHQIIVEYAGEIITQDECERRMKQVYKKDKCYYLMSFDNKMIIDATRGTIARFVNHSCEPNCEMIKWTVGGEPRMALFAGRRGIMSGEELTYDYNFDPFSSKNIQECHCGTPSCRGVLGPKPKKPAHEEKSLAASLVAGAKRKLQEAFGGRGGTAGSSGSPKKRKNGNSATTKVMNALAQTTAARAKAEQEAVTHAAQLASRQNRAANRSKVLNQSKRSAGLRKTTILQGTTTSTVTKSSRHATFSIRKVSKPSTLNPGKRVVGSSTQRIVSNVLKKGAKKGLPPNNNSAKSAQTQERDETPNQDEEEEDITSGSDSESPNITPASLRSAHRKPQQQRLLKQSKLPFQPLNLASSASKTKKDIMEIPDSEPEDEIVEPEESDEQAGNQDLAKIAASKLKGKKKANAPASRSLHKTGAAVTKSAAKARAKGKSTKHT
ncbi:unnamed protein product [Periconia digitata]|uniref:Histone-lysine N-methyltransferase n=1 Tax=Periconia digitata TaxID=1303443 RepID=A0A9W4UNY0_9PLEO|nr:unnamed protein product [Periconia digitata]